MARRVVCRIAAATVCVAWMASGATLLRHPYLQNVRSDSAVVRWTTLEQGTGVVEYSTDKTFEHRVEARIREMAPEESGLGYTYYSYHADLRGLTASTQYFYRILVDGEILAPEDELSVRTRAFSPFEFLVVGDSGIGSAEQAQIAQRMIQERPALVLHMGDIVYPYGSIEGYETRYFNFYRSLMKRAPFFPAPGNHDYQWDQLASYITVHDLPVEGVPAVDAKRYYSYDWGNVHFIALDSNTPMMAASRGTGQMLAWLEADLRRTDQFWRVAYFHHPPYASGPNERDPLSVMARQRIVPILEKYNVPLVLNGHEHSYQRTFSMRNGTAVPDGAGTVYVTSGGGGVALYPVYPRPQIAYGESSHHYVKADVNGYRINLRAIRIDGADMDNFTIAPPPIVSPGGAVNGASYSTSLAPGGLVSLFGWQLASGEVTAARVPLPNTLSAMSVTLNGQRLPLLYVSPTQLNAQLPFDAEGEATLRVTTPNGSSDISVNIADTAPALFATGGIAHADGTMVTGDAPAMPGEFLSVYMTGLGRLNSTFTAGQAAPLSPLMTVRAAVEARLGGATVTPSFAGLAPGYVGLYQVNLPIPAGIAPGLRRLQILADGVPSNSVEVPVGEPAAAGLRRQ